ncbi:MAG: hypothetical protein ACREVX_04995 [Clostridium sp.]|uniref:hypothetical protein n=1 Tax=Clostridium sp. TaxID=1506 RepID=UPI003D6D1529
MFIGEYAVEKFSCATSNKSLKREIPLRNSNLLPIQNSLSLTFGLRRFASLPSSQAHENFIFAKEEF